MKTTLLHPWHKAAGARMAPFAGFEMPIQYASAVEEHKLCRRSAGLFDTRHMGRFLLSGAGAGKALDALVSSAILDMKAGEARYGLLLNERGGVIDDLFMYRLAERSGLADTWFIVVNAGNRETDFAWMEARLPSGVALADLSEATAMIAVQGPRAVELLDRIASPRDTGAAKQGGALPHGGLPPGAPDLASVNSIQRSYMGALSIAGIPVLAGRTGYTGEDGAELYCEANNIEALWTAILAEAEKAGIEAGAIGLAARDSLRFEAGMPLHGHEISADITPPEALLSWACDFNKDFIGKDALVAQKAAGLKRKLVTLNVTGGVPREGYPVLNGEGEKIGVAASGMFCPTAGSYSANAFVPPEYAAVGTKLAVEIRGMPKDAEVIKRPLYVPVYRRNI
jgi:glycine cleavage system aminomethyltransferase T